MRLIPLALVSACIVVASPSRASAQDAAPDRSGRFADPTGGAYTSPTSLFTPAAALPSLMPRLTVGADFQSYVAPTTPAANQIDNVRPFVNAELGLPARFTIAAGTQWFGGDRSNAADRITPFAQVRWQFLGAANGLGLLGGASLTYKRVGYHGGENEVEASVSMQYRQARYELGLQGTFGQSITNGDERDIEGRVYAALRPVPALALGVSAQLRGDLGEEDESPATVASRCAAGRSEVDFIGGAVGSFTIDRWQVGALVGATTLGLCDGAAFIGQVQGQVRF